MKVARYTYRFYPTSVQKTELAQLFGCVRVVYNWGLACGRDALEANQKLPSVTDLSRALTSLKKTDGYAWLSDVSCVPLQQSLRHLKRGWSTCFAKRAKRPRFKSRKGKQSAEFTKSAMRITGQTVTLGRITEPLRVKWSRPLPTDEEGTALVSSCTVTKDACGRYHISFVVQVEVLELQKLNKSIGLDLGLTHFAIASDGQKFANPKFLERDLDKLAKAQRDLARKTKGSKRRAKQRVKVARIHARIADKRKDFAHKLSTQLIRENQAIGVETLKVKNMVKNRRLSRSISDAGWGMFVSMLEYKAQWYGRTLVKIDQWFPSTKMCSECHHVCESMPLSIRTWKCEGCGVLHDRDINAAVNIKRAAGLVDLFKNARGEGTAAQMHLAFG